MHFSIDYVYPCMINSIPTNGKTTPLDLCIHIHTLLRIYNTEPGRRIYNTEPGRRIYNTEPGKRIYNTEPGRRIYNTEPGRRMYNTKHDGRILTLYAV